MHWVILVRPYVVKFAEYSTSSHFDITSLHADTVVPSNAVDVEQPSVECKARIGDFVVVDVAGKQNVKRFVAQVVGSCDDSLEISFMQKAELHQCAYIFPANADTSWDWVQGSDASSNSANLWQPQSPPLRCRYLVSTATVQPSKFLAEQLELKQSQTEIHILTHHSVTLVASLIIFLVKNSLIVQSVYIHNCQSSMHVVLNCIFNFTCAC